MIQTKWHFHKQQVDLNKRKSYLVVRYKNIFYEYRSDVANAQIVTFRFPYYCCYAVTM